MQASIIAPIVGLFALVLQLVFGIDLTANQMEIITDGVVAVALFGATVYGGYKTYESKRK